MASLCISYCRCFLFVIFCCCLREKTFSFCIANLFVSIWKKSLWWIIEEKTWMFTLWNFEFFFFKKFSNKKCKLQWQINFSIRMHHSFVWFHPITRFCPFFFKLPHPLLLLFMSIFGNSYNFAFSFPLCLEFFFKWFKWFKCR